MKEVCVILIVSWLHAFNEMRTIEYSEKLKHVLGDHVPLKWVARCNSTAACMLMAKYEKVDGGALPMRKLRIV